MKKDKAMRILEIYNKLQHGEHVNKAELAVNYGVSERSIQRDIEHIRDYLANNSLKAGDINYLEYDKNSNGYYLEQVKSSKFSNEEILAVCKILLSSRSLPKKEMYQILDKLVMSSVPYNNQKIIQKLINNERYHYIEPKHKKKFLSTMWQIGEAIESQQCIEIYYQRTKDNKIVKRQLQPAAIMFSEYYFYLTAFINNDKIKQHFDVINDSFPTIYRIDRIKNITILDEKFPIHHASRFQEGEFLKRIQFMYGGKLQKITFNYFGNDLNSVLDRLPTATYTKLPNTTKDGKTIFKITAEVFGAGIKMWLRSQSDVISDVVFK